MEKVPHQDPRTKPKTAIGKAICSFLIIEISFDEFLLVNSYLNHSLLAYLEISYVNAYAVHFVLDSMHSNRLISFFLSKSTATLLQTANDGK